MSYNRAMEAINAMSFASKGIDSPFNACCFKDECRARKEREASLDAELAETKALLAKAEKTIADVQFVVAVSERALKEIWP